MVDVAVMVGGKELSKEKEAEMYEAYHTPLGMLNPAIWVQIKEKNPNWVNNYPLIYNFHGVAGRVIEGMKLKNHFTYRLPNEKNFYMTWMNRKNIKNLTQSAIADFYEKNSKYMYYGEKPDIDLTYTYYRKKGNIVKTSKKSPGIVNAKIKLEELKQTLSVHTPQIVRNILMSYMFFGLENIFGINSAIFGDSADPYIPDIVIGAMPFFCVQRIERGLSDRLLKYRAIGDIFLAHQRGATDTLRVDMMLTGPYRNYYLQYLLSLQQTGETTLKTLEKLEGSPKAIAEDVLAGDVVSIPEKGKVTYESHITFPIITQTAIMLDMFLQTIEWHHEKDRGGQEIIYTHLLFRKHIDPKGYKVFENNHNKGYLDYGVLQEERKRKELFLDTAWKIAGMTKEALKYGLYGGTSLDQIDYRVVFEGDPYTTNIIALANGSAFEKNNFNFL